MQIFLSNLTAALLALHTVLGCCWHHTHHGEESVATVGSIGSADSHGCDHAHRAEAPSDSHGQGRHGGHECQGSTCVLGDSLRVEPRESDAPLDSLAAAHAPGERPSMYEEYNRPSFYAPDTLLPPLRLHLICQVLLI